MAQPIQPAQVHFNHLGMPISGQFDDIYFSNHDGAAESEYVFIQGNRLPERWHQWSANYPFVLAETGFGSGLNMLLAAAAFLHHAPSEAQLQLVSFERYPMTAQAIAQALRHWPQLASLSAALLEQYPPCIAGVYRIWLHPRISLDLHLGDVLDTLPSWVSSCNQRVHAWFLDGFAPGKNPDMWQPTLYQAMAKSAAPSCTLATFTAVGDVRRGLQQAGFAMRKRKGYRHKREMLVGHKLSPQMPSLNAHRHRPIRIAIIGGGIAAATMAHSLTLKNSNLDLHIYCADDRLAMGASGNPQGAVYPLLQADYTPTSQFYMQAMHIAKRYYQQYCPADSFFKGMLQLPFSQTIATRQQALLQRTPYPVDIVTPVNSQQHPDLTTLGALSESAMLYSNAGWVRPAAVVNKLVALSGASLHFNHIVNRIERSQHGWRLHSQNATTVGTDCNADSFDHVVWATGAGLAVRGGESLTIRPVGGQVTQVATTAQSEKLHAVVCHKGYLTPADNGQHCLGATFTPLTAAQINQYMETTCGSPLEADNQANMQLHAKHTQLQVGAVTAQRRSVRAATPDHLPLIGAHPAHSHPGVWVFAGLGSRGLTSAPWAADYLSDQILGRAVACDARIQKATDSRRQRNT